MNEQRNTGKPDPETGNPLGSGNEVSANLPHEGTAPAAAPAKPVVSEETRNQEATSGKSRAESGTTAPSRV